MLVEDSWVNNLAGVGLISRLYWDDSYARDLYPPGSNCQGPIGTEVDLTEGIDIDNTMLDGGGGINISSLALKQTAWGTCVPGRCRSEF